MNLLEELHAGVVCGDGPIGTLLLAAGVPIDRCFEELNVSKPDRIRAIHEEYVAAGARVLKTNTFGANAVRLARFGFDGRVSEINGAAAGLARKVAQGKDVVVAGSVGPLGITAAEANERNIDREECFSRQISALLDGGAEIFFFETFTDLEEMALALRAKKTVGESVVICSFAFGKDGRLSSGESVLEASQTARKMGAEIVGVNCIDGPDETIRLLDFNGSQCVLAAYPNAGHPQLEGGCYAYPVGPQSFAQSVPEMVARGVRLIGGCCGTDPTYTQAVVAAIASLSATRVLVDWERC